MTLELPPDPFKDIEESRLQREIEAADRQKAERGISWAEYMKGVVNLSRLSPAAEDPVFQDFVIKIEELIPDLARAERNSDNGKYEIEFDMWKRLAMKSIRNTMILLRERTATDL